VIGLDVEHFDGVPVARPREDIDAANAGHMREQLAACLTPEADGLVVDLSDTRYVDSAGIDMLFRLGERLGQRRATLALVIPADSQLQRLAQIVALPRAMPVHATLPQALDEMHHH
jgi:anti-anti-sigma factor